MRLKQNQAPGEVHFRGVQMLAELPGWPRDVALRYHDGAQYYPMGNPASTRVRVSLAGVNYWDVMQRTGAVPLPASGIPGVEGVGVVDVDRAPRGVAAGRRGAGGRGGSTSSPWR